MKLPVLLLTAIITVGIASANVSIVNDVNFNLDNNAFIKVLATQTSTNITIYNSTSTPASTLQFYINGTPIRFTANANKTLSSISYNNATDVVTYTGNGTTGYLNVSARMNLSLRYYDFEVDGIINQTLLSNASGWVTFNYTGWTNQHNFRIRRTGAPSITSWSNNKTNNDSQTLTINISEAVNFNATANQSIDTWSWFKDNANQNNNYDNFTTGFNVAGIHTIKVNATNTNGTSNTLTWTVTVQALAVAPNITSWGNNKTNNNSQTLTINTSESIRFNATANQSIDTWNWFKDDADQTNNYDNFTTNFTSGTHTIKVNATNNANGTSDTIVWTVNVQAIRGVSLTNISALSLPANAGINATYILNLTNNGTDADSYNLSVDNPGAAAVGLNISAAYYFLNAGETKIFSLNVTGASAGTFKVNVTASSTNYTSRFAYVNTTTTVTVETYIPPTPVILTAATGNFWVNTTWQAGSGNVTDSYNSTNGTAWINSSLNYRNTTLSPHGWQNLTIYAWNRSGTGTLNITPAQNSTQIPNNVPVLSSIGDKTVNENQTLSFTISATDADGDTLTYGTNATKGSFTAATGTFTWTPTFADAGTYVWYFNSTDNYSAVASETITVAVTNVPLTITSRSPDTDPTTIQGTSRSFNITLNRTANVIWYINGASVQTNNSVASALYTNSTAGVGIYNVTASVSDAFDTTSTMWNWTVNPVATYIPPTPVILTAMTGNFRVNTTWQAGSGNITNSYNVSVNGAWTNGTTNTYVNSTLSAHAWQNVSVYAWNSSGTGTLNITPAQNNTRIPNNVPVLSPIGSKTVAENQTLSFTISATDADGDTLTYGSNITKGAFNTGTGLFTWTPGFVDSGTYVWYFNSSDGYGGVSSETVTITVNNIPLSITARTPGTDPATAAGTAQTFTVSLNRSATVTWYINGTSIQTNTSITYASYTNSTADAGIYNVTAIAQDTYDTASTSWTWTVSPVSIGAPSITSFAPTSPVSNTAGSSRTFNITVNQTVNVTWYINGTLNKSDTGVTDSSYTNTSAALGIWNVTAAANNANGAVSQQWIWNVTEAPTGVPSITSFAPTSPVSNTAGSSKTFNITVNQTVNVTWYINGTTVFNQTNVTDSSYTNTSAAFGIWNVTATANNANGAVSQQWIWNVTEAPTGVPSITSFAPTSPVSNTAGSSRNFKIIVNQTVNVTWYINGTTVFNQTNVTDSSYTNTSAAFGIWNVTAVANNTNGTVSQQWTWIVTAESVQQPALPAPTPAPGGGGGAGVISPEPFINIERFEIMEEYLGANVPTSYILTTQDIVISEVLITPTKNFGTTSIRVELLKDLSNIEGITQPSGIVYKYANIWVGAKELEGEEGIIDAYIGFRVETGWLADNNLEDNSVKLLRWDGTKWFSLETVPKNRDGNFVYYESKTIGFSPFAIVAVPMYPSATVKAVETVETTTIETVLQKLAKEQTSQWLYIFIILILIGLLLYSLIYSRKIGEEFEKPIEEKPLEKYPEVSIIERKLQQNRIYIKKYKQSINKLKDNLKDIKNR